ncbi:uncharacterized protein MAL13P1.304-like [Prorops nasuta]|uniref:uncharacterized protein MAL13P1.304-like n=1 Tax=Prorops nasuta TaxID=863751 RepID=UPI0034D00DC1
MDRTIDKNLNGKHKENSENMDTNNEGNIRSKHIDNAKDQLVNRYEPVHTGPFIVNIISEDIDNNIGNLHLMKISKTIKEICSSNFSLSKANKFTIKLKFEKYTEANKLIEIQSKISNKKWILYIPNYAISREGVVKHVLNDLSIEDILFNLNSNPKNVKAIKLDKLTRWDVNNRVPIPTNSVKINFMSNQLPTFIYLFNVKLRVKPFTERIKKCVSCQRFGHSQFQCRGHSRCSNCAGDHSSDLCKNETCCGNCKGDHTSLHHSCPVLKYLYLIKKTKAYMNCSNLEAKKFLINNEFTTEYEIDMHFERENNDNTNYLYNWLKMYMEKHNEQSRRNRNIINYNNNDDYNTSKGPKNIGTNKENNDQNIYSKDEIIIDNTNMDSTEPTVDCISNIVMVENIENERVNSKELKEVFNDDHHISNVVEKTLVDSNELIEFSYDSHIGKSENSVTFRNQNLAQQKIFNPNSYAEISAIKSTRHTNLKRLDKNKKRDVRDFMPSSQNKNNNKIPRKT